MRNNELTPDSLRAETDALSGKGPVHMVNLVRYRAQAYYAAGTELPPCSGREAYMGRYVAAFGRVSQAAAPGETLTVAMLGNVHATLVAAPGEAWDDIVIVEYPSFEVLRRIVGSPQYETDAAPHRRAALADWRFMATIKVVLPT